MTVQSTQLLHLAEEALDIAEDKGFTTDNNSIFWNAKFKQIKNVLDPTDDGDAVTLGYLTHNHDSITAALISTIEKKIDEANKSADTSTKSAKEADKSAKAAAKSAEEAAESAERANTWDPINYYSKAEIDAKVPTKTSQLTNDSEFALTSDIPTKTSQLTNDSGFAVIRNGHLVINGSELWIE